MGKIEMIFIFFGFSLLLIVVLLLLKKESYSTKKYETEKEMQIDTINTNQTNLEIPSSNPVDYVYFSDHKRRNQFNIGNEPQSPNQNIKLSQPTCGCYNNL